MELQEFVLRKMNDFTDQLKLDGTLVDLALKRNRFLDYTQLTSATADNRNKTIDRDTLLVTLPLRDLYGTLQHYAGQPGYMLHPQGLYIDIAGSIYEVADSGNPFTFDPVGFTLDLDTPLSGTAAITATGHLVNMRRVLYEVAGDLVFALSQLMNLRGQEYEKLAQRVDKQRNALWGGEVAVGPWA